MNDVQRLDLEKPFEKGWETIDLEFPYAFCDTGLVQISDNEIMIYGGWNQNSLNNVCYMKIQPDNHKITICKVESEKLQKGDFFISNGVCGTAPDGSKNKILICGHHYLHEFDLVTKHFRIVGDH